MKRSVPQFKIEEKCEMPCVSLRIDGAAARMTQEARGGDVD